MDSGREYEMFMFEIGYLFQRGYSPVRTEHQSSSSSVISLEPSPLAGGPNLGYQVKGYVCEPGFNASLWCGSPVPTHRGQADHKRAHPSKTPAPLRDNYKHLAEQHQQERD